MCSFYSMNINTTWIIATTAVAAQIKKLIYTMYPKTHFTNGLLEFHATTQSTVKFESSPTIYGINWLYSFAQDCGSIFLMYFGVICNKNKEKIETNWFEKYFGGFLINAQIPFFTLQNADISFRNRLCYLLEHLLWSGLVL